MAKSDTRRATIVGVVGVVVGTVMIVLVLVANNSGGGDSTHTTPSKTRFTVGSAETLAKRINDDQTPLFFNDTAAGSRPIAVHHVGTDATAGWIAFDAAIGNCTLTWHRESQEYTDCNGNQVGANGGDLHHYPVIVENNDVIVDLSVDATTTTSS